ncbi:hypothetical protein IOD13_08360 [Brevibacterium casei]|nr:hypothetical protein [Brevibacterium casei]
MSIPPVPNHPPRPGRRKPAEETPDSITTRLFIGQDRPADADGSTQALSAEEIQRRGRWSPPTALRPRRSSALMNSVSSPPRAQDPGTGVRGVRTVPEEGECIRHRRGAGRLGAPAVEPAGNPAQWGC